MTVNHKQTIYVQKYLKKDMNKICGNLFSVQQLQVQPLS